MRVAVPRALALTVMLVGCEQLGSHPSTSTSSSTSSSSSGQKVNDGSGPAGSSGLSSTPIPNPSPVSGAPATTTPAAPPSTTPAAEPVPVAVSNPEKFSLTFDEHFTGSSLDTNSWEIGSFSWSARSTNGFTPINGEEEYYTTDGSNLEMLSGGGLRVVAKRQDAVDLINGYPTISHTGGYLAGATSLVVSGIVKAPSPKTQLLIPGDSTTYTVVSATPTNFTISPALQASVANATRMTSVWKYTSGLITTTGKKSFKYFYAEVRAKVPFSKGVWSAPLWFYDVDGTTLTELDLMENPGTASDRFYATYHSNPVMRVSHPGGYPAGTTSLAIEGWSIPAFIPGAGAKLVPYGLQSWQGATFMSGTTSSITLASPGLQAPVTDQQGLSVKSLASAAQTYMLTGEHIQDRYHTWGVLRTADMVRFYYDGQIVNTITTGLNDRPLYALIDLAVGGGWPGSPDGTSVFPSNMDIQWVKVWEQEP